MSLKARLAARTLPTAEFRLRISDDSEAREELGRARVALKVAERKGEDQKELTKLRAAVTKAEKTAAEHYETLQLKALRPADMEALIDAHPARKGQDEEWNTDTFRPALIAACVEGDMSAEDWVEFLTNGPVSLGEVRELYKAALAVNDRTPNEALGKGLAEILSSF